MLSTKLDCPLKASVRLIQDKFANKMLAKIFSPKILKYSPFEFPSVWLPNCTKLRPVNAINCPAQIANYIIINIVPVSVASELIAATKLRAESSSQIL